ncbi:MAG: adenosylhomocysteinase [Candidatus Binatia bacterium]
MLNNRWQMADSTLAQRGQSLIRWTERRMPALARYKQELAEDKPLAGLTISGSLHLTPETAALARCLQTGGAEIVLSGSNPLSTRDEVCASLVQHDGIAVFAYYGEDRDSYFQHLQAAASVRPDIVLDDGADLIAFLARSGAPTAIIGIEQTTTGVQRLRSMEAAGVLPFSVIALNDAPLKQEFDNLYGTGQNTVDGILRATNILIAGKSVVVAGYGWAGRGIAARLRGCGAHVIVTEVNPVRALHAYYDGFRVMPMSQAVEIGDLFVTATGCADVLSEADFANLKNGAVLANSGHFDVEIDIAGLERIAVAKAEIRPHLTEYTLTNGRQVYVLAQGRLVGQSAAEASPADIMDLTFTLMAVTVAWAARERDSFPRKQVMLPPAEFTERVASLKLSALELQHDHLTAAQEQHLASWGSGT